MNYLLFSLEGRIRRTPYWICLILLYVAYFVIDFIFGISTNLLKNIDNMAAGRGFNFNLSFILFIFFSFFSTWASMALNTKRLHDLDKSGWWQLIYFIPFVNILFFFYIGLMPTDDAPNRFGNAQPK